MYQNNVLCDLFVGKGAGKKIISEIEAANHSVKIISPYISASLINKLIQLHQGGVDVKLITTDAVMENSENYANTYKRLISEEKIYNKSAQNWKTALSVFTKLIWLAFASSLALFYVFKSTEHSFFCIITMMSTLCIGVFLQIRLSKFRTFEYAYETLFPIKLLIAPENANYPIKTFIHSKIYIIDDQILYLGSLNFTASGTTDNYETRIRTQDLEAVEKMIDEFDTLFETVKLPERKISVWGNIIYHPKSKDEE